MDKRKSDVYVLGCYSGFQILIPYDKVKEYGVEQICIYQTRKELLVKIRELKEMGLHIPRSALRRVGKEIRFKKKIHRKKQRKRRKKDIKKRFKDWWWSIRIRFL